MPNEKKRLEWLDAMRGFTMILVVAVHVSGKSYGIANRDSSVQELITLFRMPLFFFVSGFLAYKSTIVWSGATLGKSLLKKIRVQLIPTVVFLMAFQIYYYHDYFGNFFRVLGTDKKGGYWFTWVLLLMFIAYYLFAFVEQRLQKAVNRKFMQWLPIVVVLVLSLLLYESTYMPKYIKYPKSEWSQAVSFSSFAGYFCFFIMGNICRRFWPSFEKLFDSRWFFPTMVFLAFLCSVEITLWHNLKFMWRNLPRTIDILAILFIVLMSFRHYERHFTKETRLGRVMQHIGTRTLDIYLIHYFFLPKNMQMVGEWFKHHHNNVVPEIILTIGGALVVIAFCCLTSAVLRTSPFLKKWLFGKDN